VPMKFTRSTGARGTGLLDWAMLSAIFV